LSVAEQQRDKAMKWQNPSQRTLLFAVSILAIATEVRGEIVSRVPGDIGWKKSIPLQLILEKRVIEDLGLSADVSQKLTQLHEQIQMEVDAERRNAPQDGQNKAPIDRWVRKYEWNDPILHTVRNRHSKELNELLTSDQQNRLYQLHLQSQKKPTDVLCDKGVAKELGLSESQQSQILRLHLEVVKAEMDSVKAGGNYSGPSSSSLEKAVPEKLMQVLSEEQRKKLEELRGQPLKKVH
jgi:hypothetical protein